MKPSMTPTSKSQQTLKILNATVWLAAGVLTTYSAIAVLYPARVLDTAWRNSLIQACADMQGRCQGISLQPTSIRGYWHGLRIEVRATPKQMGKVRQRLETVAGVTAAPYIEWVAVGLEPGPKS